MKTFEELPVWQEGRKLVREIYRLTRRRPFSDDYGLCDQIQRAAVSITSNIAEGYERGLTQDLMQFLFYAKGSAGEVRSQLYHVEDIGYASEETCSALRRNSLNTSRQLSSWIQSMQMPRFRAGPKFHKQPDRTFEKLVEKAGFERQKNGTFRLKTGNGKTDVLYPLRQINPTPK